MDDEEDQMPDDTGEARVGDFRITAPYAGEADKIGIYRTSGEGGDFDRAAFEAHIAKFYAEHF